jgi:hypothetical protein
MKRRFSKIKVIWRTKVGAISKKHKTGTTNHTKQHEKNKKNAITKNFTKPPNSG